MVLTVKKASVDELYGEANFSLLVEEYAQECSIAGLPHPAGKFDLYKNLEKSGAMYAAGAYLDGTLIGFLVVLAPVNPHYGVVLAVAETLFVTVSRRPTGAGLRLIDLAKEFARAAGSPGLLISAPVDSPLISILPRKDFVETNRVFFCGFANE